eukprot:12928817-Alexandrium_andersonii.AAC.1
MYQRNHTSSAPSHAYTCKGKHARACVRAWVCVCVREPTHDGQRPRIPVVALAVQILLGLRHYMRS